MSIQAKKGGQEGVKKCWDSQPRPERSLILRSLEKAACDKSPIFLRLWEPESVDRAISYVLY